MHASSPAWNGFLTSSATPVDFLVTRMAVEPFDPHTYISVQALVGLEPGSTPENLDLPSICSESEFFSFDNVSFFWYNSAI